MIIRYPSNTISFFTNTFGVYNYITFLYYFQSITPVVMIPFDAEVGLVASLRKMYACCTLPLAHIMALKVSSLFSFNKIRLSVDLFLSNLVILLILIGSKTNQPCSCCISSCAAAIIVSPDLVLPCFKLYVSRKLQSCKFVHSL